MLLTSYGEPFIVPIDPCHFDDAAARFMPPYMHADAILTTRLAIPAPEPVSPAAPWANVTPPQDAQSQKDDKDHMRTAFNWEEHTQELDMDDRSASALRDWSEQAGDRNRGSSEPAQGSEPEDGRRSSYAMQEESWENLPDDARYHIEAEYGLVEERTGEQSEGGVGSSYQDFSDWNGVEGHGSDNVNVAVDGIEEPLCDYSVSEADVDPPIRHMQLLLHTVDSFLDMSLLCVASPTKLYYTMASALLQRRAIGVVDPIVGIVFEPGSPCLRLALGWTVVSVDIGCVSSFLLSDARC